MALFVVKLKQISDWIIFGKTLRTFIAQVSYHLLDILVAGVEGERYFHQNSISSPCLSS